MKDYLNERAQRSKNAHVIFDNKTKVIVFLIAVGVGGMTIWEKCASLIHQSVPAFDSVKRVGDPAAAGPGATHKGVVETPARRRHLKSDGPAAGQGSGGEKGRGVAARKIEGQA